jgi:hypothetical protein
VRDTSEQGLVSDVSPRRGRALRIALLIVGLALVSPAACFGVHRATHPAPLGRDIAETEALLARVLPVGTRLDSAKAYFDGIRIPTGLSSRGADGSTLIASQSGTKWFLGVTWRTVVAMSFDSAGALQRFHVEFQSAPMP